MLELNSQEYFDSDSPPAPDGEPLTLERALSNLTHSDVSLRYYAAWWLGKFGKGESGVVEALIDALHDEEDRTELGGYPLRRNAARALGKLKDRRAVPELMQCLDSSDFYVRKAAAQSLGMLGDPSCTPALIRLLEGGVEAAQLVPGRPHLAQPIEAVLEALEALNAVEAVPLIEPFIKHSLPRVHYAAARALYGLTQNPTYGELLVQALSTADLKLRRPLLLDLGASGYLAGAEAIAHASVENSFKMIALKSLLEKHLQPGKMDQISPSAEHVMVLMDALL